MENLAKRIHDHQQPDEGAGDAPDGDVLLHLVGHEVRASVRALSELPLMISEDLVRAGRHPSGPLAQHLQLMTDHGARLDRLMNDVVVHSRIGRMQSVRRMNLRHALDEVLSDGVLRRGFRVRHDLRQGWIEIGERDVLTLLSVLLRNACDHHDGDTGDIFVRSRREGDAVVLQVLDDGPGIPSEFRRKVLEPMTRLGARDATRNNGMGLAHAAKIARRYGGTIQIEDGLKGRGSCIELRFPLAPPSGVRMRTLASR